MEYRKFDRDYVVRFDRGDEISACLKTLCEREKIGLAEVSGLGAARSAVIGIFDPEKRKFVSRTCEGAYEIASCVGNVTQMDGKVYLHLHATLGNTETGECVSGHLAEAVIGLTGEFFVRTLPGSVERAFSEETGLNQLVFRD